MTLGHVIGATGVLALIAATAFAARAKVKSFDDFATGSNRLSAVHVAGTIIGTIVGGASTVGAAQLAFKYGLAGWWFSLGSGFALAFLGLVLSGPLRRAGVTTIPQFLARSYGEGVAPWSWLFTSIGLLLNIIGQVLAAVSLLSSVFGMKPDLSAVITTVAVILYVIYGGVWSAGSVGLVKTTVLVGSMLAVGWVTNGLLGGLWQLRAALPAYPYFSLLGRGVWVDLAAAFSLLVGVASTQTYLQAVFAGRDASASKKGTLLAALIAPLVGLPSVVVGMYMRVTHPGIVASAALPQFVTEYMNPVLAGAILATLFISVIGTAAGLGLGIGVMFAQDIYRNRIKKAATDAQVLAASRIAIFVVAVLALVISLAGMESLILKWSFLSMGLRGSTVFFPLMGAVFLPRCIERRAGVLAVALAPLCSLVWGVLNPSGLDPLYIGLTTSVLVLGAGRVLGRSVAPQVRQAPGGR